jgi:lipoyl(octanoyl) transferase
LLIGLILSKKLSVKSSPPFVDWGRTDYREAVARQAALVEVRKVGAAKDVLVFTEHNAVFTLGSRRGAEKHVLWDATALKQHGIEVIETNRGGDVTYHGPGQIVAYPIVCLEPRKDLHEYLRVLEQAVINTLGCFGLATARRPGQTGVWVGKKKIAAMGVAVRSWVAWHGLALNVEGDLGPYSGIIPCGLGPEVGEVTSLERELGKDKMPPKEEIKQVLAGEFWRQFEEYLGRVEAQKERMQQR